MNQRTEFNLQKLFMTPKSVNLLASPRHHLGAMKHSNKPVPSYFGNLNYLYAYRELAKFAY